MLLKLNRFLRYVVLVVGGLCAALKIMEKAATKPIKEKKEFQTVEFDDIW